MLSTTSSAPLAWAISAAPAMSEMSITGLVGVSMNTIRVAGVIAAATASSRLLSTHENDIWYLSRICEK